MKTVLAVASLALLAACAANPTVTPELEQARGAVGAAQADPQVASLAPSELDLATRTLGDAERLSRDGAPAEIVAHRAYVAEQRARIARQSAEQRAAEGQVAHAREERRRSLEARAREAEEARERAEALQRESQQRLEALERARQAEQSKRLAATEELGAQVRQLEAQVPELRTRETERGWVISLDEGMLFHAGEANLQPSGRRALDNIARVVRQHPGRNVLVEGFARDAAGTDSSRRLAERRAHAVRNALVLAGVDGARIIAHGEPAPERRVEIVIAREPHAATGGGR